MSGAIAQCGGCKRHGVKIEHTRIVNSFGQLVTARRACCTLCGRVGVWKGPEGYEGIVNEALSLIYAKAPAEEGAPTWKP